MKTGLLTFAGIFSFLNPVSNLDQTKGYVNINVPSFKEKMNNNNAVIIDVRTPSEIQQGKIDGALEIDFMNGNFESQVSVLDKDATYLIYCRSGRRSARTCSIMAEMGFNNLFNLSGGYIAWSNN